MASDTAELRPTFPSDRSAPPPAGPRSTTARLARSAVLVVRSAAEVLVRPRLAVRCPRCDHPFASSMGPIQHEHDSGLGRVDEASVCPSCARRRVTTLVVLSVAFVAGLAALMFLAP
jgi:hypothetical protein